MEKHGGIEGYSSQLAMLCLKPPVTSKEMAKYRLKAAIVMSDELCSIEIGMGIRD